jgi:hypothetical protein
MKRHEILPPSDNSELPDQPEIVIDLEINKKRSVLSFDADLIIRVCMLIGLTKLKITSHQPGKLWLSDQPTVALLEKDVRRSGTIPQSTWYAATIVIHEELLKRKMNDSLPSVFQLSQAYNVAIRRRLLELSREVNGSFNKHELVLYDGPTLVLGTLIYQLFAQSSEGDSQFWASVTLVMALKTAIANVANQVSQSRKANVFGTRSSLISATMAEKVILTRLALRKSLVIPTYMKR